MAFESYDSFESVKSRLDEIVDAVNSDDLPLDDALALYEEAVGLGLRASNLLEEKIEDHHAEDEATEAASFDGAAPEDASAAGTEGKEVAASATIGANADASSLATA